MLFILQPLVYFRLMVFIIIAIAIIVTIIMELVFLIVGLVEEPITEA